MKKYLFDNNEWKSNELMYSYSPVCKVYKEFSQEDGYVKNNFNEDINDFDYISLITKEKYAPGTHLHTRCSFDKFGAPLIVITDDVSVNKDGKNQYGLHFEVVAYEDGCNVWHIVPFPERTERPIKPTLIGKANFKIEERSEIDIDVLVGEKKLAININGRRLDVEHPDLPDSFHAGITACEGINNFYEFTVEG